MAVTFVGHKLHYTCDDETDISPSWIAGAVVSVTNSGKNYMMLGTGSYTIMAQAQTDWGEANTSSADYLKNKPTALSAFSNDAGYITSAALSSYLTASTALAVVLTGLSTSTNSAITSSDSIVAALGKLQAQVTAVLTGLNTAITTITPSLVGSGATGTQVSATKRATIRLGLNESVTSSIGGAATAVINIKICATNSATEGSWTTLFTFEEDQTVTLAIALQSIQVMKGVVDFDLPAGYYWKAESSGSGTNSEGILTGQQTIYG